MTLPSLPLSCWPISRLEEEDEQRSDFVWVTGGAQHPEDQARKVEHLGHNCPRAPALVPTLTVLITQTPRMPVSSAVWVWPASWCLKTHAAA